MDRIADLCEVHARRQDNFFAIPIVFALTRKLQLAETYPWLDKYEHSWPTLELLKQNLHSCKRRIKNARRRLAAAADMESDSKSSGDSDGETEVGFESSGEE
jgi:hypothetical protein